MTAIRLLSCLLACALPLSAQTPANATTLNPTQGIPSVTIVQFEDTVHALTPPFYARSDDGGRTWPVRELSLGLQPVALVATTGRVVVAGATAALEPAVVVSTDRGVTWNAPVTLGVASVGSIAVCIDGLTVVALWTGNAGAGRVWTSRSGDGGLTWSSPLQLNANPVQPFALAYVPQLIASGSIVHASWVMNDSSTTVTQQQLSLDGGLTWLPQPRNVPVGAAVGILGTTSTLFAMGAPLLRSTDQGATWVPLTVPSMSVVHGIAVDGTTLLAAGVGTSLTDYVVDVSTDLGVHWQANPLVLPSIVGFAARPRVVGSDFFVEFVFPGNWAYNLVIHSGDAGAHWRSLQSGLQGFAPGPRRELHVVTTLSLPATTRYHTYVGAGYTPLGGASPGTGGVAPRLSMGRVAMLGVATDFTVESAVGGSVGVLGLASAGPLATPLFGGTLWLQGSLATAVFATNGAVGGAGVGSGQVPLTVPNVVALVGAQLTAQALVVDAAATAGFALTGGCEVWLR